MSQHRIWILIICGLLCGACSSATEFKRGWWPEFERIKFKATEEFEYEWWSDDGGTVCLAEGTFAQIGRNHRRTTTLKVTARTLQGRITSGPAECHNLPITADWFKRGRSYYLGSNGPFRPTKE